MSDFDERVELTLAMLRREVSASGYPISADGRVSEANAAKLLRQHPDTLRRLRGEGAGPSAYKVGVGGSKISYRIFDLAIWLEDRRDPDTT